MITVALVAWSLLTVPPAPTDFVLYGSLDAVVSADPSGAMLTTAPIMAAGWVFECRSGLQPVSQRQGTILAYYTQRQGSYGIVDGFQSPTILNADRADVVPVFQGACPAMGPRIGYIVVLAPPTERGPWTVTLEVTTTDGAGHPLLWRGTREIVVY